MHASNLIYRLLLPCFHITFALYFFIAVGVCTSNIDVRETVDLEKPLILVSDSFEESLRPILEPYYRICIFPSNQGLFVLKKIMALPSQKRPLHIIGLDHQILNFHGIEVIDNSKIHIFCYETYGFIFRRHDHDAVMQQGHVSLSHLLDKLRPNSLIVPDPRISNTGTHLLKHLTVPQMKTLRSKVLTLTDRMMSAYALFKGGCGDVLFAYKSTFRALGIENAHFLPLLDRQHSKPVAVFYIAFSPRDTCDYQEKDHLQHLFQAKEAQALIKNKAFMNVIHQDFSPTSFSFATPNSEELKNLHMTFSQIWKH